MHGKKADKIRCCLLCKVYARAVVVCIMLVRQIASLVFFFHFFFILQKKISKSSTSSLWTWCYLSGFAVSTRNSLIFTPHEPTVALICGICLSHLEELVHKCMTDTIINERVNLRKKIKKKIKKLFFSVHKHFFQ